MTKLISVLASLLERPLLLVALIVGSAVGSFGLGEAVLTVQRAGNSTPLVAETAVPSTSARSAPDAVQVRYGPPSPELSVVTGEIGGGMSLAAELGAQGVKPGTVDLISREMRGVFDFRRAREGDRYRLIQQADGTIAEFAYTTSRDQTYRMYPSPEAEGYTAEHLEDVFIHREARIAGVISTTLYDAIRDLGEQPQLATDFSQVFAWDIDFSRSIQPGDEFRIVYERLYKRLPGGGDEYIRPGKILAAHYRGGGGDHTALYFQLDDQRGGYYRPDGSAMARQFLAAPLKYSRISSSYSLRRRHPITGRIRPHRGIDYAAPRGTPIWSIAEGTVIHKGWAGGMGKMVKVRHANGFVSYYGHLSRYGKLKKGQRISQKQVIGYVGSTGAATGPHLHFQLEKNGRLVNPAVVQTPAAPPVPEERLADFQVTRDALMGTLRPPTLLAEVDEAGS